MSGHRSVGHFGHNDTMTQAERSSTDDTDTTNHQPSPRPQTTVISGGGAESFYRTPSIDSRPSIFNGGLLLQEASLGIREKKTMDLRLPTSRRWTMVASPHTLASKMREQCVWKKKRVALDVLEIHCCIFRGTFCMAMHAYGKPHSQCWVAMVEIYLEFLQKECNSW